MMEQATSCAAIGRAFKKTRAYVFLTVEGKRRGKEMRKNIADFLGLPYSIWEEMDRERRLKKAA